MEIAVEGLVQLLILPALVIAIIQLYVSYKAYQNSITPVLSLINTGGDETVPQVLLENVSNNQALNVSVETFAISNAYGGPRPSLNVQDGMIRCGLLKPGGTQIISDELTLGLGVACPVYIILRYQSSTGKKFVRLLEEGSPKDGYIMYETIHLKKGSNIKKFFRSSPGKNLSIQNKRVLKDLLRFNPKRYILVFFAKVPYRATSLY